MRLVLADGRELPVEATVVEVPQPSLWRGTLVLPDTRALAATREQMKLFDLVLPDGRRGQGWLVDPRRDPTTGRVTVKMHTTTPLSAAVASGLGGETSSDRR